MARGGGVAAARIWRGYTVEEIAVGLYSGLAHSSK